MADDHKLKFTSWDEWDIEQRKRLEEQEERDRTNAVLMRMKAVMDALMEKARLEDIKREEEAERTRREVEEEAKRKLCEDVRAAVDAVLEEDATPLRRELIKRARPKPTKADEEAKKAAKAAEIKRLVPIVKAANVLAGGKLSITDPCVERIRPHLPKEEQRATYEILKGAIRKAKATP